MILNQSYYDEEKIVYNDMLKNAIKSYVDGINDPYTVYMDSEENS
jgi:C-terminal processing protease CtpA/Prc